MTKPPLATLSINGKRESGLKNIVHVRDLHEFAVDEPERLGGSNAGPNPLEYLLGALSACTSIITASVAKEQNFNYSNLEYSADGILDPRGFKGIEGVLTYFQTVNIDILVETDEDKEAFTKLAETVEQRCPLFNLIKDAGVEINATWTRK